MNGVIYAGMGIAGATALGSLLGLAVNRLPEWVYAKICSLAAGIMLYAAVMGLIAPAGEMGGSALTCVGILLGAVFLERMNKWLAGRLPAVDEGSCSEGGVLLVLAIVIHHFPEGMAAGVSFGTGDVSSITAVCTGIALQNIPEAMMILPSMTMTGAGRRATGAAMLCSGGVELLGLCLGYVGVQLAADMLPFLLAFAGGTMLFVVLSSMVTEDVYGILIGLCGMMLI